MRHVEVPDNDVLRKAADLVHRYLAPTPVVAAPALGEGVVLKLESMQPTGSFKARGALVAVSAAMDRHPGAPLIAASAGNHGLGVAYAASTLGVDATVVVAETASPAKVASLEQFAVTLVRHGRSYDEAERFALELAETRDGHYLSPYNDADVIAGQASIAGELLEQVPGLAAVVVPVGGGGLVSGVALALSAAGGAVQVFGVEPEVSPAMSTALAAARSAAAGMVTGHLDKTGRCETFADGLAGSLEPGSVTVEICRRHRVDMSTVGEGELARAVRTLAFELGLVAEGAGAAAVAAVRSGRLDLPEGPVAVLLTGRNIAADLYRTIIAGD